MWDIRERNQGLNVWRYAAAVGGITSTTPVTLAAALAGNRAYLTQLHLTCGNVGTTGESAIRDGSSGTVIWRFRLVSGSPRVLNFIFPVPLRSSVNTLLEFVQLSAPTTDPVHVNAAGYYAP